MKNRILLIASIFILAAGQLFAAADVNNLVLSRQGDKTVLRIDVSNEVTENNFAVDATDEKPYRIIVDLKQAIHRLTLKNFMSLPQCAVSSIRTSQYQAEPDKIVRIVLDMDRTVPYEVKTQNGYVYLYLNDPQGGAFLTWNSSSVKPPVLAGADNPPKKDDAEQKPSKAGKRKSPSPSKKKADSTPVTSPFKKDYLGKKPIYADKNKKNEKPESAPAKTSAPTEKNEENKPYTGGSGLSPVLGMNKNNQKANPPAASAKPNSDIDWSNWEYVRPQSSTELDKEIAMARRWWRPKQKPQTEVAQTTPPKSEFAEPVVKEVPEQTAKSEEPIKVAAKPQAQKVQAQPKKVKPEPKQVQTGQNTESQPGPMTAARPLPQDTNPRQSSLEFDHPLNQVRRPASPKKTAPQQPSVNSKPQLAVNTPVDTLLEETPGSVDTTETAQVDKKKSRPTSRFRRKPIFPAKLKGTIVAEFPTRMVIKYSPGKSRDPFKTLIAEDRKNNSPTEKRIPDIETSRLVGVLESTGGERRALLEDLDGYGYIVKTGDRVKKGYVGKIDSDRAYFRLFEYGWSRTVALYLSQN